MPINHDNDIKPAKSFNHDFGHINSPSMIWSCGLWFFSNCATYSLEFHVLFHLQIVLPHQSFNTMFTNFQSIHIGQMSPNSTITPQNGWSALSASIGLNYRNGANTNYKMYSGLKICLFPKEDLFSPLKFLRFNTLFAISLVFYSFCL
jgi:hypothetical protein